MVTASTPGRMAKYMKENGHTASKKVKVFGKESLATHTLVSGVSQKLQVTASTSGKMVIGTKVNGTIV